MRQLCGKEHLESRTDNVWWRPSGGMVGEKTEDRAFGVNITFFGWGRGTSSGSKSIWSRGHIITFGDNSAGGEGPQHRHCCQINSQNTHDHQRSAGKGLGNPWTTLSQVQFAKKTQSFPFFYLMMLSH